MKRYQLYLDPHSVSVLDEFGKQIEVSRSKLIQMAIDYVAHNLKKVFVATKTPTERKYIFDSLVGAIKLKGEKKTSFARDIDEIYLRN